MKDIGHKSLKIFRRKEVEVDIEGSGLTKVVLNIKKRDVYEPQLCYEMLAGCYLPTDCAKTGR